MASAQRIIREKRDRKDFGRVVAGMGGFTRDAKPYPHGVMFRGREYRITGKVHVGENLAKMGLISQNIVRGKNGAIKLYQVWKTEGWQVERRMIDSRGRSVSEHEKAVNG